MAFLLVIVLCVSAGCGKKEIAFTTGLTKNELFKIDGTTCSLDEANIILLNLQREYEGLFGSGNWGNNFAGCTIGDYLKEQAVKQLSQIRSLSLLANKEGITLDKNEIENVKKACDEYLDSIDVAVRKNLKIEKKAVENIFTQYCLANKYYNKIIQSVDSEISDDEARIISVQYIFFSTKRTDENGRQNPISDSERNELNAKILSVMEKINAGEEFEKLAVDNSDDGNIYKKIGRGETDSLFEKAAFDLTDGQVSEMVNTDDGIYLIKCISNYNESETLENKRKIYEERCEKALNSAYDEYISGVLSEFNTKAWDNVRLKDDQNISGLPDLFAIYRNYLPQAAANLQY